MGLFSSDNTDVTDHIEADPQGVHVTPNRVRKIDSVLENNEPVHYMASGFGITDEGHGAGQSSFGGSGKLGTGGRVRTAFTNNRVVIKIPQITGDDQRIIPYSNITSIDLDTGFFQNQLILKMEGHTYQIQIDEPGKDESREIASFVRDKINEVQESNQENEQPDPTEQLVRLKELHEDGVVTEEEFKEKKQNLLDKI